MTEHYGAATLTPVTEVKREVDVVKSEPRINGFNNQTTTTINVVTSQPHQQQQQQPPQQLAPAQVAIIPQHQAPTEMMSSTTKEPPYWHQSREQQCCLVENGRRCSKAAGNASYSKRIQKTVAQRKLKLHMDNSARHIYICDYHKNVIQSVRAAKRRARKDSGDEDLGPDLDHHNVHHQSQSHHGADHSEVDLYQLQVSTLRRYKKHFKVGGRPGLNKAQLADVSFLITFYSACN